MTENDYLKAIEDREKKSKEGLQKCPHCGKKDWWQTGGDKQCNKCYRMF